MNSPPSCIRCNVAMELGFVPELSGQVMVSVWHPGAPTTVKKSWAERIASPGGIRFAADEVLAIDAYRCPDCGRVELFALRPPGSP
ncbi:hypothetical protein [Nannocystis pusilla]|uniref:hypothetical protein n=1 Tax=Nannocystis pusilla TaxID=889268 RepID=UPI003B7A0D5A